MVMFSKALAKEAYKVAAENVYFPKKRHWGVVAGGFWVKLVAMSVQHQKLCPASFSF